MIKLNDCKFLVTYILYTIHNIIYIHIDIDVGEWLNDFSPPPYLEMLCIMYIIFIYYRYIIINSLHMKRLKIYKYNF